MHTIKYIKKYVVERIYGIHYKCLSSRLLLNLKKGNVMAFTGNEDHRISLAEAAKFTKNYRKQMSDKDIKGGFFGRDAIRDLLSQSDCVGIRIYNGLDDDDKPNFVLTGVLANEDDIDDGLIMERGLPCPPDCGKANSLNSDN